MAKTLEPITTQFLTYNTKTDPSNADQRFLVKGSKNVLINNTEKFKSRQGYTLQSAVGTQMAIKGSTEWEDSTGDYFPLRSYFQNDGVTGILEFLINGNWETLMSGITSVALVFDPYWDNTEKIDRLLWCDGSTSLFDWSGATATLASISSGTVTAQGTKTFGQQRFLTTNTRAIRIKDDNGTWHRAAYGGGEATTTLTGLDTNLTAFPFSGGNLIVQEVITRATQPDSTFKTDFLKVIENQVWAGSRNDNRVYVSKNTSVTDYTFSTPRVTGEGALLTLDGPGRGVDVLKGDVILFAGLSYIYKSVFNQITVGSTLAETIKVERLKTTSRQGALYHHLITNIGNGLVWLGNDNVLYELTDATLAYNPVMSNLSDPVKPDFDVTDFTGGHMRFESTRIYISAPNSTINFLYEFRLNDKNQKEWFWQPPQTMPTSRWAVIGGVIHGHSSSVNETYKLFDGYNDNGKAINCIGILGRWNGGARELLKNVDELFDEGNITANTILNVAYLFDKDGGDIDIINKSINGTYALILYPTAVDVSLGNLPLGDDSLAGDVTGADSIQHFRVTDDVNVEEFFDYGVIYQTNDVDYRWEILCHGNNATLSTGKPTAIKNNV